ncbi:MAG: phosphate starvation protein PhoH [Sulfuricurvum sp. PC08-66]|nr:MAG: phosphate starvation protein PhoH [Sulfuricurvum sp. PC08-66]
MFEKYYLLDTNILLEDATNLFLLAQNSRNLIIIPETVIDEIDAKKSGYDEINFQARTFARLLEEAALRDTTIDATLRIVRLDVTHPSGSATVEIVSKTHYHCEDRTISPSILNDRKILEVGVDLQHYLKQSITFLSMDMMARLRAISLGLDAQSLNGTKQKVDEFAFVRKIAIPFSALESLPNALIEQFDIDYRPHYYAYEFSVIDSDQIILCAVENGRIVLLNEIELRDQDVVPLNKEQLFFSYALGSPLRNIIIVEAMAGSGKTLLALSGAIKLVRQKMQQKIIYIRNSIESTDKGEDVGYLPGLEEKFRIYNHPLMDSIEHIILAKQRKNRDKNNPLVVASLSEQELELRKKEMLERYMISTMWVGEMRGRTLSQAVVIIDEAQNMSNKTMQMVLSRIDASSKVIILGSNKQIDNIYVNKHTNALTTLLAASMVAHDEVQLFALRLTKVLRGPITAWAEKIFSKK